MNAGPLRISVVTLFPELFATFGETSLVGRAVQRGLLELATEALRAHGLGKHASVDDTPYGGGSGMVLRVDCVVAAIEAARARLQPPPRTILLTPSGERFSQRVAERWVGFGSLLFVCGRYEGFDERVHAFVDEEASLGDFVMTGGEVAAMAMIETVVRLVPGVLGNDDSSREESFSEAQGGALEYPQYTRPVDFRGLGVPEVLTTGDHAKIGAWRASESLRKTRERRPDLLGPAGVPAPASSQESRLGSFVSTPRSKA